MKSHESGIVYVLIGHECVTSSRVQELTRALVEKFGNVFSDNLPKGLPPLRDIWHQIDLILGPIFQTARIIE